MKTGDKIVLGGKRGTVTCIDQNGVHVNFENELCSWGPTAPVLTPSQLAQIKEEMK